MIVVLILAALIAWVVLSAFAVLSYRACLVAYDHYGPGAAFGVFALQATLFMALVSLL